MSGICDTCKRTECYMQHDGDDSCPLYMKGEPSNYKKLFGTPERAAQTLVDSCKDNYVYGIHGCSGCPAAHVNCKCGNYDALLEWLKGGTA